MYAAFIWFTAMIGVMSGMIPEQLSAWRHWAAKLQTGSLRCVRDYADAICALSDKTIRELGEFYLAAEMGGHREILRRWLMKEDARGAHEDEAAIRNLVTLFHHLGQQGYEPFARTQLIPVGYLPSAKCDWSKLPAGMSFLGRPAESCRRFEYVFSEAGRERIRAELTHEAVDELKEVADAVRHVGYKTVMNWVRNLGVVENVEASLVFKLLGVLDALGLCYYD